MRLHYVISNGGGQPNIVPGIASVWYYFRDHTFDSVKSLYDIGIKTADAAAMMTDTTVEHKLLGTRRRTSATSRWPSWPRPISRWSACRNGRPTTRPLPSWCRKP